jgi:(p)ppGpp synthase/HD superfamily hydrolase
MRNTELLAMARGFAFAAHLGQTDKAGKPYVKHLERVADRVFYRNPDTQPDVNLVTAMAVAWLHDVVEDTEVELNDLEDASFPTHVVAAVDALTHRRHEPRGDYYARVRSNALALVVKRLDVEDNADPDRLALLDEATRERLTAKYEGARNELAWYERSARS